jgi:NAD(P)-dependent dehydrogenase (short-subunit alcohol dehydrogenase family)
MGAMSAAQRALFDLTGRVAVVTGGTGALGQAIALGLARHGARVGILARDPAGVAHVVEGIVAAGGEAEGVPADVRQPDQLVRARTALLERWDHLDILVNAAGGNQAAATVPPDGSLFDLDPGAVREVVDVNLMGTFLPIQIFGRSMAAAGRGAVVNVSSMAASRPLSRVAGYGAAKAAVENLTKWLADHVARRFGPGFRVNAIAPGFFLGTQNRDLLVEPDGGLTERGRRIVDATPMGRFGEPDDLIGTVVWLASDASRFVTGAVVPVDGGFSAAGGL